VADEGRILHIASAVAAGAVVDWDDADRGTNDEWDRRVLTALQQVAKIADVARDPSSKHTGEDVAALQGPATWGHLRIIDALGRGSFGAVYRAWDATLEREVALKLIPTSNRVVDLSRARKEARRLARVRHPNVVTIFGADFHDDYFGLWMERIPGATLGELLLAQGTMSAREAAGIGVDLCHALAAVHGEGLLHGDIKAGNIMRQDGGRVVLMDFGAGGQIPKAGDHPRRLAGTPAYLAPEVLAGRNASTASDIYSLGVLLYYLVSRRFPVEGKTSLELAVAHAQKKRVPLRDVRPDLPAAFVNVIERAISPDANDRYPSAGHFGAALAEVTGSHYQPDRLPWTRWRTIAAAIAAVAVVAAGIQGSRLIGGRADGRAVRDNMSAAGTAPANASLPAAPLPYRISAAFYALRDNRPIHLAAGSPLAPGDQMFFSMDVSQPVFVYVVNQDDKGESNLLFPLPGVEPGNPVPSGTGIRLPGSRNAEQYNWVVTSAGGRDHFFVYVSPQRLADFEQLLAALPRAQVGRPIESVPLSRSDLVKLRGVGGLATSTSQAENPVTLADLPILPDGEQTAEGVWARRITFENPVK
jgi:eukaryotic-like serine/threonine-protein kinase